MSEQELMLRVAAKHGVDGETVREEIGKALRTAKNSSNTAARAFWSAIPEDASDKEIVQCIAALLLGSAVEEQN
ncbi:MAG: hypothetical protein ACLUV2_01965 [Hominenteromicrobium sp.]|uniref:hypothetical protein n=1 Tax=Hominenteromicrobium sp. TaxID=3073581 RepID=UPI003999E77D